MGATLLELGEPINTVGRNRYQNSAHGNNYSPVCDRVKVL